MMSFETFRAKIFITSYILIEIIYKLSGLDTLKISSFILSQLNEKDLRFISKKNKITKVYLEKMNQIEEVYFLIKLCSRMTYLKINVMNVELFVKNILMKIKNDSNQYLRSLCVSTGDDM